MSYVLTYFKAAGRGFAIRVCMGTSGLDYKNVYMTFPELLAERGPAGASDNVPLGQLPVLKLPNGDVMTQSIALARFAAKKAGLYPRDDDEEALRIDEVVEVAAELMNKCPQNPDAEVKKTLREAFVKEMVPKYCNFLAKKLGGNQFFGGAKINLADLILFSVTSGVLSGSWDFVDPSVLDPWPTLVAHAAAVKACPLVVEHGQL